MVFKSRQELRSSIESILIENKTIFDIYGPNLDNSINPESETADIWKLKVKSRILPNSRKLLALLDANKYLLTESERITVEEFRQHVDDLTARHINVMKTGGGMRFPIKMNGISNTEGE
jgi:hypothetical protein